MNGLPGTSVVQSVHPKINSDPVTSAHAASRGLVRLGCRPVPVVVPRVATLIRVRNPNELQPVREPGARALEPGRGYAAVTPLGGDFGVGGWVSV